MARGGRSIETHRRLTVGLIMDRPESGPYQGALLEGAHRKAVARDHNLLVLPASALMSDSRAFPDWSLGITSQHGLDGLIVASASLAAWGGPSVVCANDNMAFGVLHELHARGIRVPEDVAVTGFDDVVFSEWMESPLSTVRQPMVEVGELAVSMLFGESVPADVTVSTESVLRRSCGCPQTVINDGERHLGHQLALYFQTQAATSLEGAFTRFAVEYHESGRFSSAAPHEASLLKALGMPWWFLCHADPEAGLDLSPRNLHLVWDSGRSDDLPVKSPTGKAQAFPDFLGLAGRWTAVQIDLTVGLRELASCRRQQAGLWVFFIDLDGLKQINDQWGHEAGDEAIGAFAQVLVASMRTTDLTARLGGDEFTLLASHADASAQDVLQDRLNRHGS